MDFHGMKRKDLQALCKKHGIPANLKNIEMATRLASVFEKENEETSTETIVDVLLKDDLVVKKVRFSPENEVFEFTRSVKRCQRKNVGTRSKGIDNVRESGIELRRSTRIAAKGKTVVGSNENEALKVPRPSKRIGFSVTTREDCKGTELEQFKYEADISEGLSESDHDGFNLENIGRRSTRLTSKPGILLPAKNNVVSMDFEVQETGTRKDVQDDTKFEKVPRRSRRIVNDIDVQANTFEDQRRSTRLKAKAANSSMGGESSDGSKEENQEGELVKHITKELSIVQTTKDYRMMKLQDASKVPRHSKRGCNDINVLMDKRPVKVKRDHQGINKAPQQSRQREKCLSEFLVNDKEMIRREATPETRKEYLNTDESGALSEMQVRREPSLIYRTQVKPKRHDMKENAPNSKIVHNLNVTAPRTSKRQPLQDLRKN